MQYIDFTYYSESYGGNKVTEPEFKQYETQSRLRLDRLTFDRVKQAVTDEPAFSIPEEIKDAQCMIIDCLKKHEGNDGATIASETVGKHSVTYSKKMSADEEIHGIVKRFLGGSPWTFRGGVKIC